MDLPTYFQDFIADVRLSDQERAAARDAHQQLRQRLDEDQSLGRIVLTTFLQGSYRRSTDVKPSSGRPDVDVVVVTRLHEADYPDPGKALEVFKGFLRTHYPKQWSTQGRSLGISPDDTTVDLDLVVTSAPSAATLGIWSNNPVKDDDEDGGVADNAEWKREPLRIPDRTLGEWQDAHPVAQLEFTRNKNRATDGNYIQVVRAIKWWKRQHGSMPSHPKSYPLEHLIGSCCPDRISSVAEGVVRTLETLSSKYASHAEQGLLPFLPNHGAPLQNVLARVSAADFATFIRLAGDAARTARRAFDEQSKESSVELWHQLFGDAFPKAGGFSPRAASTTIAGGRFG